MRQQVVLRVLALVAVRGQPAGPYALAFADGSQAECDQLVFAMRYHLIRNVNFGARLWNSFGAPKRAAIANIKPADNGKLQLEFASRDYDVSRVVSGQLVHLSAVSYSDTGTAKAPGFISTWERNPRSPSGVHGPGTGLELVGQPLLAQRVHIA